MAFFYNETKSEVAGKRVAKAQASVKKQIPIASMQSLGCSACPRNADEGSLKSPKMKPSGAKAPSIYLLGTAPNRDDDATNLHWSGQMGDELYAKFGKRVMDNEVRSNYLQQCMGDQNVSTIECCRNRIVADIEAAKPTVIVGIGDHPLTWATGIDAQMMSHRGTLMTTKIGTHVCWYYPLLFPNYMGKKSSRRSEYELTFEHDIRNLLDWLKTDPAPPKFYSGPYDEGIEIITGQEPGDMERLERALRELAQAPNSGIDIETNCLRPFMHSEPHIWTASVGTFKRTIAFPIDHPDGWGTEGRIKRVKALFFNYLVTSGKKTAHNLAFELEWFNWLYGADALRRTEWDDTMAMAHTFDERKGIKSVDYQTRIRFGFWLKDQSRVDPTRLLEYPIREALRYNGMDTKWTDKLRDDYLERNVWRPEDWVEYRRKIDLAPTLVLTEALGMPIDMAYAKKQHGLLLDSIKAVEGKISRCPEVKEYEQRYGRFEPTAPEKVLKLLKDICQRDEIRVEEYKGGQKIIRWTTDEDAIAKIPGNEVPSVPLILEHRGLEKLRGTYVGPIVSGKNVCVDGRIRPKYNSMVAETGRLSADDPAIQNWPQRKHREIRGMVAVEVARRRAQRLLLACDYGQIEFRVVGMASEDPNLIKYCWTGYDVHKFWAQRLQKIYPTVTDWIVDEFPAEIADAEKKHADLDAAILKLLRQEMKNKWVFPQLFGSSLDSCADNLQLPKSIAEDLGEEFWDDFRVVKKWQNKVLEKYEKNLYVETLGGRRRRGPMRKEQIINHPIQGTACGDIVVAAMNAISMRSYLDDNIELQPIFNGHDDLTFEMNESNLDANIPIIVGEMLKHRFDYINVPLVLELKVGYQWHKMEEIKVYRSHEVFGLPNPYS